MDRYKDLTTPIEVSGPFYTEEDCVNHECIAAIIRDDNGKILMMDHVKMNCWAVPVGKVKRGDDTHGTLREEMLEELGIEVIDYNEIISFIRPYIINDIYHVDVVYHIFDILKYSGDIKNLEPHKHRSIKFISMDEIIKLERISTATKATLIYNGYKIK